MDSIGIHLSDGIKWSPSMSIGITRSEVVKLNSDNELTFCPLLNSQISSFKKYSIEIKLSFSSDFMVPLITKYTQTSPFYYLWMWESQEIRHANFVALARLKESGESIQLIFVPSPTTENDNIRIHNWRVSCYCLTWPVLYLCGHNPQVTLFSIVSK